MGEKTYIRGHERSLNAITKEEVQAILEENEALRVEAMRQKMRADLANPPKPPPPPPERTEWRGITLAIEGVPTLAGSCLLLVAICVMCCALGFVLSGHSASVLRGAVVTLALAFLWWRAFASKAKP